MLCSLRDSSIDTAQTLSLLYSALYFFRRSSAGHGILHQMSARLTHLNLKELYSPKGGKFTAMHPSTTAPRPSIRTLQQGRAGPNVVNASLG